MGVDGATTLGGGSSAGSDLSDPGWGPDQFQAYQLRDYLDFRAVYNGVENRSVLRLWSNLEAHLYGELILHDGAIRSINTMSIHCVTNTTDIVSFRSGTNVGDEIARLSHESVLTIFNGSDQARLSPSLLQFTVGATIQGGSGSPEDLELSCKRLYIDAGTTPSRWGYFDLDSASTPNVALLKVFTSGGTAQDFSLYANKLSFYGGSGDLLSIRNGSSEASAIENDGSYSIKTTGTTSTKLSANELRFYGATPTVKALDGSTPQSLTLDGSYVYVKVGSSSTQQWGIFDYSSSKANLKVFATGSSPQDLGIHTSKAYIYSGSGDLVSFFTGGSGGSEVGVVTNAGTYAIRSGGNPVTTLAANELRFYGDYVIKGSTSGSLQTTATIEALDVTFVLDMNSTKETWGKLSTTTGGIRKLTIAHSGTAKKLRIEADELIFLAGSTGWGSLYVTTGGSTISFLKSTNALTISAASGVSTWENLDVIGSNLTFTAKGGTFAVKDNGGTTRLALDQYAALTLTASTGSHDAKVSLDSTSGGGSAWTISSDHGDDELKVISGGTTVRVTPSGSIYVPEYVGTSVATAAPNPTDGDPDIGGIVVETDQTTNPTYAVLWVKVSTGTTTNTSNWWYVPLTKVP